MTTFKNQIAEITREVALANADYIIYGQTLEDRFESQDRFEQAVNILAMNNISTRRNGKASVDHKELWDCDSKKVQKKSTKKAVATIKATSTPKATYIPTNTASPLTDYVPKNADINTYKVVNYHIYRTAIVLEILDSDIERNEYIERTEHEANVLTQHIVFRYVPFKANGQPNPYDGITQLKTWLKSQKFITAQNPTTIKESLEMLKGNVVSLPKAMHYNYTRRSDLLTVYTLFGEFDEFDKQFSDKDTSEYTPISEYTLRDEDSESSDSYPYEFYGSADSNGFGTINYFKTILKYDCHKEFREQLPLSLSHISAMFD